MLVYSQLHMSGNKEHDLYRLLGNNRLARETSDGFLPQWRAMSSSQQLEFKLVRNELLNFLGLRNFAEIPTLFGNERKKDELNKQIVNKYCEMLGIAGTFEERERRVNEALHDADAAIHYLTSKKGIFGEFNTQISMINEITAIHRPVDLLLLIFSPKASPRAKFEARRKLLLAESALKVHLHREQIGSPIDPFLRLLNTEIWTDQHVGELSGFDVLSRHDAETYACLDHNIILPGEERAVQKYERLTRIEMRSWNDRRGKTRYVMMEHRLKDIEAYVLKMVRKNSLHPEAVDDAVGLNLTFQHKRDIEEFLLVLQAAAHRDGSTIRYEDITDTIGNIDQYQNVNPGSSSKFEVVKVHLVFNGVRIELMIHTIRTYLNYRYQDEISWDEYQINRVTQNGGYDHGVAELLFPKDMYQIDWQDFSENRITLLRQEKRSNHQYLPPQFRS